MEKQEQKKRKIEHYSKQMLVLAIILILLIGGTYAWLRFTVTGEKENRIKVGTLVIDLDESATEGINIEQAFPVSDEIGKTYDEYKFTIKNSGSIASKYRVELENQPLSNGEKRMPSKYIKYNLVGIQKKKKSSSTNSLVEVNEKVVDTTAILKQLQELDSTEIPSTEQSLGSNMILPAGVLEPGEEIEYSLKLWMSIDAKYDETRDTVFNARIKVDATQKNNPNL